MNNYNSQIADWNNPAKDQAITGQIDGERSKALMDVYNQAQQQMYQQYRDYQGQQLAKQQAAAQAAAEQAKAAASIQAAQIRAAQTSAKATQAAATATVKPKTAEQSYNDALAYWSNKKADVQQEGAYRVEQALRNDPAQIQALNDQGYDINKVIDALYSSASDGRFNSKNDFTNYYNGLVKQVQAGSR